MLDDNRVTGMNKENADHVTNAAEQPNESPATASNDQQGDEVTTRKPTIEDIFAPPDVGQLLQKRKYHEAYVISSRLMKFDSSFIGSKGLVDHCRCCMLVGEGEEAIRTRAQLKKLLIEKSQTTPHEIKEFADSIRGEGRDMEAILFFQIAAEFYGNKLKAGLVGIANCCLGVRESIESMLSRDEELKPIVRTHVIPLMQGMRKMIQRSSDVGEEDRCLQEVWCLHRIEYTEYLVNDLDSREKTLKEAIAMMKRVYKKKAGKSEVYGVCLNNLGITYELTSRPSDACQCFREAIAAYAKAEDINDDERAKEIANSKRGLAGAKNKTN
ncbi:uncharacterized protein LOC100176394 isoform X1 [Ciona intestinalis]